MVISSLQQHLLNYLYPQIAPLMAKIQNFRPSLPFSATIMKNTLEFLVSNKDINYSKEYHKDQLLAILGIMPELNNMKHLKQTKFKITYKQRPPCNLCLKTFSSEKSLEVHMKTHESLKYKQERRALCKLCLKTFANKNILQTHIKLHNPDMDKRKQETRAPCQICSKTFGSKHILKTHIELHDNELREKKKEECIHCGEVVRDKRNLLKHIRFIHRKEKLFKCKHCGREDYSKDKLQRHVKYNHGKTNLDDSITKI